MEGKKVGGREGEAGKEREREERVKGKEEGNKGESKLGWRFVFVRRK